MNIRHTAIAVALALAFGAVGFGAYRLGMNANGIVSAPATETAAPGRKILYWQDPMVPGQRFDKPGKSPFMDMPLQPVYADAAEDAGGVSVSPRLTQSLGLRTAEVVAGSYAPHITASGSVVWNERGLSVVQARNTSFVEKLYVRATLDRVARGQALADLYVPDWVAAQEEFLAVRRMQGEGVAALVDAARLRMRQAGMPEALIAEVEQGGRVKARVTLRAPEAGSVVELAAREGMTVMPGATLFRLNALDTVWVNAEVPEAQAAAVAPGAAVEARAVGFPGQVFTGRVQTLLPEVDPATRTLKARIELTNPGARLVPGMFVDVSLGSAARQGLWVPAEALIRTGRRSVVMLAEGEGRFRPLAVETGAETGGRVEVLKGLQAGQQVVVSGQFLVDSEASLRATDARAADASAPAATPAATAREYQSTAVFESLDGDMAMLSHQPVPELKWGAMTMGFGVPKQGWPKEIKPGQRVHFSFVLDADGQPVLTHVMPLQGGKP